MVFEVHSNQNYFSPFHLILAAQAAQLFFLPEKVDPQLSHIRPLQECVQPNSHQN